MKTIFILLFLLLSLILQAQKNIAYLVLQPEPYIFRTGAGIGYERQINKLGLFTSICYTNHAPDNRTSLKQIKTSMGLDLISGKNGDCCKFCFAGAINYSHYFKSEFDTDYWDVSTKHLSYSFGCGATMPWLKVLALADWKKREVQILTGWRF
jgi:hypothetical protein